MKKEQNFKTRIEEIAAKIAGNVNEYDAGKVNLPDSIKTKINSAVTNQKDMAQFILDMIEEIIAGEPGMSNIEKMSGWNSISTMLKRIAGEKAGVPGDEDTPDVSQADMEKNALPPLKEAFNRINRK